MEKEILMMRKSVYIHIPFCKQICSYCDFPKFCYQKKWISSYLDSLEKEIDEIYEHDFVSTIYIGGGTPTCLEIQELERLLKITKKFKREENCEFTIEANTQDLTPEKIKLLKAYGINRVSIGVQTFRPHLQKIIGRKEEYAEVKKVIDILKQEGITNINLDLMYALPKETLKDLEQDLEAFLSLDIKHISTYSLILEEHTHLFIKGYQEIEEDLDFQMYHLILKTLKKHGFDHYEVSNFSHPGYPSKHNLCYWNNLEYYGFGLGASGYLEHTRYTNPMNLTTYQKNFHKKEKEVLTEMNEMEYEMILGLRKTEGVSNKIFEDKYHKKIEEAFDLTYLLKNKLIEWHEEYLRIPEDKIYLSNEILIHFLKS